MEEEIIVYCHDKTNKKYFSTKRKVEGCFEAFRYTWSIHRGVHAEHVYHVSEQSTGCKLPIEGATITSAEEKAKKFLSQYTHEVVHQTIEAQQEFIARHKFEEL